jgi:hypothetical protein
VKISKTSLIFLVVGILIISAVSLGFLSAQQNKEMREMQTKLDQAKMKLASFNDDDLPVKKDQVNQQIQRYNSQIADAKMNLVYSQDNIDTTNIILEDAKGYGVTIDQITSPGSGAEVIAATNCDTLSFNIQASGDVNSLAAFASSLSEKFPTSIVKVVQIEIPPPTPAPIASPTPSGTPAPSDTPTTAEPAVAVLPNIGISLVIYDYKDK